MDKYTGHKQNIIKRKMLKAVFLVPAVLLVIFTYFLVLYYNQPFHVKNADSFVATAVVNVVGENYNDSDYLTREKVICIISDVFSRLKQKGFEETKSIGDSISQALQIGMLKGNNAALQLEMQATIQDALVFIARGLMVPEDNNVENNINLLENIVCSNWAKPQLEELIFQGYFTTSDIAELHDLREDLSISELKMLLNKIVNIKTRQISFYEFTISWVKDNAILSIVIMALVPLIKVILPAIASTLGFAIQITDRIKQTSNKKKMHGAICLAGVAGVGKTTLKNKIAHPATPLYIVRKAATPTNSTSAENLTLLSSGGNLIFDGIIIDVPGISPQDVFTFLATDKYKNKILLLVLAHTKADDSREIDMNFINEELLDIEKVWGTAIRAHNSNLKKIVVFINKKDLLSEEYDPVEMNIYGKHMESICNTAEAAKIPISVIEGSSFTGSGLNKLYEELRPISL